MNLVAAVKPLDEVQAYGLEFAKRISRCAPLAVRAALKQMHVWFDEGDAAALKTALADEVKLLNSKDCAEAMHAMIEKRAPVFIGE